MSIGGYVRIYGDKTRSLGVHTQKKQVKDVSIERINYHNLMIACRRILRLYKVWAKYVDELDIYVKIIFTMCTYFSYRYWQYVHSKAV